jgi:hypothetical protein
MPLTGIDSENQNTGVAVGALRGKTASVFPISFGPAAASYATAGNVTYTAADVVGGTIVRVCAGGARSDVLPTAALMVAGTPSATVGMLLSCLIINGSDAAETITIGAGTGGAFDTNQTAASRVIPQNSQKEVRIRLTNVTSGAEAYVVYA